MHAMATKRRRGYLENNLEYLQEKVLGKRISIFIAGDLHHYRRHEDSEGRQKITAGGGGAFLHPTHAPAAKVLLDGYVVKKSFPDEKESRRLARKNLLLMRYSPLFGLITGALYLMLSLTAYAEIGHAGALALSGGDARRWGTPWWSGPGRWWLGRGHHSRPSSPSRMWRSAGGGWWSGAAHGLAHILAAFACAWGATLPHRERAGPLSGADGRWGRRARRLAAPGGQVPDVRVPHLPGRLPAWGPS